MSEDSTEMRFVGPVMRCGDMADAVVEAIQADNAGRKVVVEEHASYLRIKVEGECTLLFETVGDMLGRDVGQGDIEANMPSFEGFIRVDSDRMRFLSK